jgi:hypothetical protein
MPSQERVDPLHIEYFDVLPPEDPNWMIEMDALEFTCDHFQS